MKELDSEEISNFKPTSRDSSKLKHGRETLSDFIYTIKNKSQKLAGIPTKYWKLFNLAFGGLRPELIILTAETGNGKSTFARNWFQDCMHQKIPSCLISLEESIDSCMRSFAHMEVGKPARLFNDFDITAWATALEGFPFYYLDKRESVQEDFLIKTLYYAIEKYGVKFFVIDHLDYITKKWGSRNESYVIGDFLRKLAGVAHAYEVTILLIAHPSKLSVQGDKRREVGIDDLKGSSSVKQEADAVFSLFRESIGNQQTYLKFLKIRNEEFSKNQYTKILMNFDSKNLRFEEIEFNGKLEER